MSRPLYTTFPKTAMLPDLHSVFPAEIKDIKADESKGIQQRSAGKLISESLSFPIFCVIFCVCVCVSAKQV